MLDSAEGVVVAPILWKRYAKRYAKTCGIFYNSFCPLNFALNQKANNMAKGIFLEGIEREQLRAYFDSIERKIKELGEHMQPKEPPAFLSRKEVAATFGVTLPTVHDWTKKGLLKSYRMGNRILYKRHEVEAAITPTRS